MRSIKRLENRLIVKILNRIHSLDGVLGFFEKIHLEKFLGIHDAIKVLQKGGEDIAEKGFSSACKELLETLDVRYYVTGNSDIPRGPVLYTCNHPYGLLEGIVFASTIGSIIEERKEGFKIIGNAALRAIKNLDTVLIPLRNLERGKNGERVREAFNYLEQGGNIFMCPAGTISGPNFLEYPWQNGIKSLLSGAEYVVPMNVSGPDHSKNYNRIASHKLIDRGRYLFFLDELVNKAGKEVTLSLGEPIRARELRAIKDKSQITPYLRQKSLALKVTQ